MTCVFCTPLAVAFAIGGLVAPALSSLSCPVFEGQDCILLRSLSVKGFERKWQNATCAPGHPLPVEKWHCLQDGFSDNKDNIGDLIDKFRQREGFSENDMREVLQMHGLRGQGVKSLGIHGKASRIDLSTLFLKEWISAQDASAVALALQLRTLIGKSPSCDFLQDAIQERFTELAKLVIDDSSFEWSMCKFDIDKHLKTGHHLLLEAEIRGDVGVTEVLVAKGVGASSHRPIAGLCNSYNTSFRSTSHAVGNPLGLVASLAPLRLPPRKNYPLHVLPDGGWDGIGVLEQYDTDRCDIDYVNGAELDMKTFLSQYAQLNRPVKMRAAPGWLDTILEHFTFERLNDETRYGNLEVEVGSKPYAKGSKMSLAKFLEHMRANMSRSDPRTPGYIFALLIQPGLTMKEPSQLRPDGHLVDWIVQNRDSWPFPPYVIEPNKKNDEWLHFYNLQLSVAPASAGSDMHFHNAAFNTQLYGKKRWWLVNPSFPTWTNYSARAWLEDKLPSLRREGVFADRMLECVQEQGDIIFVPKDWSHMVLNLQESVSLAYETEAFNFDDGRIVLDHKRKRACKKKPRDRADI